MKRIGIFGGTFNPPHLAHKRLALEMMKKAQLDEIIVIPTFVPPHKQAKNLAKSKDRLEMCRLTFSESCFAVSDIEIKRKGKSYTYDTLCQLKKLYPGNKFFLIIGSDMLLSFHEWFRYKDILSLVTLCVISRQDDIDAEKLKVYAKNVLNLSEEKEEFIVSKTEPIELSSTLIRKKIQNEEDVGSLVEQQTNEYIKKRRLYT